MFGNDLINLHSRQEVSSDQCDLVSQMTRLGSLGSVDSFGFEVTRCRLPENYNRIIS